VWARNLVFEEALAHWWGGGAVAPKTNKHIRHTKQKPKTEQEFYDAHTK